MATSRRIKSKQQLVLQQIREMTALERKVTIELQQAMSKILALALKHGDEFSLRPKELTAVHNSLRDAQIAAHLIAVRRVRSQLPATLSFSALTPQLLRDLTEEQIQGLEAKYDAKTVQIISSLTTDLNRGVRNALSDAVESNVTPKAAVQSFFSKAGLTQNNPHYYETLLRTQTQLVYNSARWEEYQRPEIDEIIWGYEYVTVGDDRVRPEHVKLDGTKLPKDDPLWRTFWPPNGYNCRCQTIPIFDKVRSKRPPADTVADAGFGFNPGEIQPNLAVRENIKAVPDALKDAPRQSKAEVVWHQSYANVYGDPQTNWNERVGADVSPASLVGAPDGSKVYVNSMTKTHLRVYVEHPDIDFCERYVIVDKNTGELYIKNSELRVNKPGVGRQILRDEVANAKAAGIKKIVTEAAGSATNRDYNGYYTWARYGYDRSLEYIQDDNVRAATIAKFPEAETILDIMATEEGRQWWKKNGGSWDAEFDLTPGSRSLQVFDAYLIARGEK